MGQIYENPSGLHSGVHRRVSLLTDEESDAIARQGARALSQRFWGSFVAFVAAASNRHSWIFASPLGALPCYFVELGGVTAAFARVDDFSCLRLRSFSVDNNRLRYHIAMGEATPDSRPALKELKLLESGSALIFHRENAQIKSVWDPRVIAERPFNASRTDLTQALRDTVLHSVGVVASLHDSLLVRLSGGLDSSILVHAVTEQAKHTKTSALNYYWEHGAADERPYARAVAKKCKVQLFETLCGTDVTVDRISQVNRTAAPVCDLIDWQEREREQALAKREGADAILSGLLGDALFESNVPAMAWLDHAFRKGLGQEAFRFAVNLGMRGHVSIWRILRNALSEVYSIHSSRRWSQFSEMLNNPILRARIFIRDSELPDFLAGLSTFGHPWLNDIDMASVPLSKLPMISALIPNGFCDDQFFAPESVPPMFPFRNQPLVELCLRIPSHHNVAAGNDRALARSAFQDALPTSVLNRTGKGHQDLWMQHVLEQNKHFVRDYILEGYLLSNGILDGDRVRAALPGEASTTAPDPGSIFELLYTEAWARAWVNAPSPIPFENR